MIDPKELRINNIIGWRLGTGTLVIGKACGIEIDRIAISEKRVYVDEEGLGNESQGFIKINGIEPIPLTEDWLRRMDGVEKIESSITVPTWTLDIGRSRRLSISLMAGNTCVWLQAYDPKDSREVTDLVCLFNSDYDGELYVHWFQNLVSAIYRPWN